MAKTRSRWTRFSLRFLLALMFACGCALLVWRMELRPYQRQVQGLAILNEAGGQCETVTGGRAWLRRTMGDDAFPQVVRVDLTQSHSPNQYRDALPLIPTVQTLSFGRGLADEDVRLLSGCTQVRDIDLSQSLVSDHGLQTIRHWPELRLIRLGYNVTDAAAPLLSHHPHLVYIDFRRSQFSDAGLQQLTGLPKLHKVVLDGRPISDEGLLCLLRLPELKELHLRDCTQLTDYGVQRLSGLKLKILDIRGCRLSPMTQFYLREKLPQCEIKADNPSEF